MPKDTTVGLVALIEYFLIRDSLILYLVLFIFSQKRILNICIAYLLPFGTSFA